MILSRAPVTMRLSMRTKFGSHRVCSNIRFTGFRLKLTVLTPSLFHRLKSCMYFNVGRF